MKVVFEKYMGFRDMMLYDCSNESIIVKGGPERQGRAMACKAYIFEAECFNACDSCLNVRMSCYVICSSTPTTLQNPIELWLLVRWPAA